jgi:hypothetical protein
MDTEQTKTEAKETAATATEKGKEVAGTASDQAKAVADTAREQVGQVRQEVAQQGREVVSQATAKLQEQGRAQAQELASTVRGWADQTRALAEGRPEEAGQVAQYARQAADGVANAAGKLEERGFEGVVDDLQRFARRRPGVFLFGAAVAGFGVGRLLRGASAGNGSSYSSETAPTGYTAPASGYEAQTPEIGSVPVGASQGDGF